MAPQHVMAYVNVTAIFQVTSADLFNRASHTRCAALLRVTSEQSVLAVDRLLVVRVPSSTGHRANVDRFWSPFNDHFKTGWTSWCTLVTGGPNRIKPVTEMSESIFTGAAGSPVIADIDADDVHRLQGGVTPSEWCRLFNVLRRVAAIRWCVTPCSWQLGLETRRIHIGFIPPFMQSYLNIAVIFICMMPVC